MLVDVDGVLSLWGHGANNPPDGGWTLVDGLPHFLSATAAGHLRSALAAFDPVWCTGWEERANEHLPDILGLGPWDHLSFDAELAGSASPAHWKLAAIDRHAGPDRPLAWVDDAFNPACHAWAAARAAPTLLLTTLPAVGVTAAHATQLVAWADALRAR